VGGVSIIAGYRISGVVETLVITEQKLKGIFSVLTSVILIFGKKTLVTQERTLLVSFS
jgi:hypothetical protein